MTDFLIRPMTADDAPAVSALEKAVFSDPWSENDLISNAESPFSLSFVAVRDFEIVGYLTGFLIPPEAELYRIAAAPENRRLGIGQALLSAAVAEGQKRAMETFFLEVRASNAPAIRLYSSFGFSLVDRRKNYYRLPTEDALIYRLTCKM